MAGMLRADDELGGGPVSKPILAVELVGTLALATGPLHPCDPMPDPLPLEAVEGARSFLSRAAPIFEVRVTTVLAASDAGRRAVRAWLTDLAGEVAHEIRIMESAGFGAAVVLDGRAHPFEGSFPDPRELAAWHPWYGRSLG